MKEILILYYTRHGAVGEMAKTIARGVENVDGVEATLRTVPPVSTTIEQTEKSIPDKGAPYVEKQDLARCNGIALGSPTRFGNMAAALKYFLDGTINEWLGGTLSGKPAGVFTSTASMHGGQETTLMTMMMPLLHHGAFIVGVPYQIPELTSTQSGGTPYGPSHYAGANSDLPLSDAEKIICKAFGERLAKAALQLDQPLID